ncbi:amino acid ABC transporter permease [Bosea sp. (in: a-proteobacteria)]|uniref:amino acid ABC transporter permease n=1 Tax=Bosea sp. (in: a-proteobacteria) TaxID=1871050 RepID=UPI002FC651AB
MIREFGFIDVMYLVGAARWTLVLTATAFAGASVIGLAIAIARILPFAPVRWLAAGYTHIVQGTPLLVWLFLIFFGLPLIGISVNPWLAAAVAFSVYGSAFLGEIWRGALVSIARTQWEAGASLGLSLGEQLRYVIIPQSVRVAIPPTVGFLVQLIKNTSLAAVIGLVELTREGQLTAAGTYKPFAVYITVACIYFLMCFPLTQWSRSLERKLDVAR